MHTAENRAYHGSLGELLVERTTRGASLNELHERPAMLEIIGDVAGLDVVDLGAGDAFYAVELVGRGAASAVALEGSLNLVGHAAKRVDRAGVADRVRVLHHDLEEPFGFLESDSADLVVCALVVHHVSNRAAMFTEVRRVVRAGGVFILSTTHPFEDWRIFGGSYFESRWVDRPVGTRGDVMRYERAPISVWVNELLDAGFVLERMEEPQPHPRLREVSAEKYERLMANPSFWILKLRRR